MATLPFDTVTPSFFSELRYIGQLDRTYLVCEAAGELVLIEQHAAHERVQFQRLRRQRRLRVSKRPRRVGGESLRLLERRPGRFRQLDRIPRFEYGAFAICLVSELRGLAVECKEFCLGAPGLGDGLVRFRKTLPLAPLVVQE